MTGPDPRPTPFRAVAATLYGTLLLVALAIPGGLVGSLRDRPPGPVTDRLLAAAEWVEAGLDATGISAVYAAAKARFRALSCGGPDSANPC